MSDERKTAGIATGGAVAGAVRVDGYAAARAVLRDERARQAGFRASLVELFGKAHAPILFLEGEAHRRQRAATARFFAPKVVATRYRDVIAAASDRLVGRAASEGTALLDALACDLAVTVAAEIVGLTERDGADMAGRLDSLFATAPAPDAGTLAALLPYLRGQWRIFVFYLRDVRPAIRARRRSPREDVISHLIAQGYSDRAILTECVTYGAAGMVTTREFISMAAWHLLERPDLRTRFLDADDDGKIVLLEEILRLEPVVGTLYRRGHDPAAPDRVVALDIRAANSDETMMGACPHAIDPDRRRGERVGAAGLAFGDGAHRCPGAGVAMLEAALFLDRLLRLPGVRLDSPPRVGWNPLVTGYELRGAVVRCDR